MHLWIFHPSGDSPHVLFKRRESNEGFKTESYRDRGFRKVTLAESGALFQAVGSLAPSPSKSRHTPSGERHKHCLVSSLRGENRGRNDRRAHSHQSSGGKNIFGFGSSKASGSDSRSVLPFAFRSAIKHTHYSLCHYDTCPHTRVPASP